MTFDDILAQVLYLLQRQGRVSYRALKRRFDIDDEYIEDLKAEIIQAQRLAVDEDGTVLVWTSDHAAVSGPPSPAAAPQEPADTPVAEPVRELLSYTPQHLAEKILTSRSILEGERKQVTVLFCDLTNSTAIAERIGPEAMHNLLNRFFELALEEVHRYEGTINQFLGDGFMALFGAPVAHEDHATRAVLSALALQRTIKEAELGKPYGVECSFRMGLNSGLVVVGSIGDNLRMDYSAIGDTTNLASRLQGIAEPGMIVVSESTSRLVQGYVRLEALQPVQVKGKTEPVTPYTVIGTLAQRSPMARHGERTFSRFVGRDRELAVLDECFAEVEAGQGQVVGIVAEAGAGKSRLLYEFRRRLPHQRVTTFEGRCLSYGSTMPYHPLIDMIRDHCDLAERDNAAMVVNKVHTALRDLGLDAGASAPYILQLLGVKEGTESIAVLTSEAIRTRTFATLTQMILQGSQHRPLIVEVEDLHWTDKTSEDYLISLVESLAGTAIMLLTTYRPGYRPPWLDKSYATQLSLRHLTSQDALTVVHSTRQQKALPEHLEQMIIEKAEGNPFFLEELTRAVIEQSGLEADRIVPDTIQGVLSARIDRLPEDHKHFLQTTSVLGREFSPRLLDAIWDGGRALEPLLLELKRLEFLYERIGVEEPIYVFKHALTQEVAYESLLTTRRQALHLAAGQALETLYAEHLQDAYDRLAYHYARTAQADKAVAYLGQFAEKAARSFAHSEAITALEQALGHVERLPAEVRDRRRLELILRQVYSLFLLGRLQEGLDLILPQHERLERLQDPALASPYYFWLSHTYSIMGDRERAAQNAQRALEEATRCEDEPTLGKTYYVLAVEDLWSSRHQQGVEHGRRAVSLLERTEERYWLGIAHWVVGFHHTILGNFELALEAETQTQTIGEAIGDPRLRSYADWSSGWNYAMRGDWEVAIDASRRGLEHKLDPYTTAVALGFLGYAYLEKGDTAEAISVLERSIQQLGQFRYQQIQSWMITFLSEAYLLNGSLDKAQGLAIQGLERTKGFTFWYGVGWSQRVLGRIAQANSSLAEAEPHLQAALQTFASIRARFEVGRTHLDLAVVAHSQGNQEMATTHLTKARALFDVLQVPRYVERTAQLASACGLPLAGNGPVSLETL
jgi:class 3 adenylate cyclase/tetratricopeptide (TPR) repeat protein